MKINAWKIVLFTLALGVLALGGDSGQITPVASHSVVSAVRTEKCPDCGQTIKMRQIDHDTWEFSCPKCGEAMRTEPTSVSTLTARCPSGDMEIRLTRVRKDTVNFECPGCKHLMVLKCPDCGQGVLKYQKVSGEPTSAQCASCHKAVDVK